MAPRLRPLALVRALVAGCLVLTLAACGDSGGDEVASGGGGASAAPDPSEPSGFPASAARRCSDLINGLDASVTAAAREASLALLEAKVGREPLDQGELGAAAGAFAARVEQLERLRDELAAVEVPADARSHWEVVVAAADPMVEALETRVQLLESGDPERVLAELQPGAIDPVPTDDVAAALEALDLAGRDCEVVYVASGNDPAHAAFLREASSACTAVTSRRHAEDHEGSTRVVLEAVAQATRGGTVTATDDLTAALEALLTEWERTLAGYEAVTTDGVPDAAAWQTTLDFVAGQVSVLRNRLDVVGSGDEQAVAEAFQPLSGADVPPAPGDLEALGLAQRDCRAALT